jgi:hypothetical protein
MKSGKYRYQSVLVRKLVGHGLEMGLEVGLQQGLRQGQQEGRVEGEQRALFKVLRARGFTVDDITRWRILACTELAQLELWLGKAVTVSSVQGLFKYKLTARSAAHRAGSPGRNVKARRPRAKR